MNTTIKLVAFAAAIALVFFTAYLIGGAVGPMRDQAPVHHSETHHEMSAA